MDPLTLGPETDGMALKRVKLELSPDFGEREDDYCVVCQVPSIALRGNKCHIQDDHKMKTSCFLCKTCGARGHLAKNCDKVIFIYRPG